MWLLAVNVKIPYHAVTWHLFLGFCAQLLKRWNCTYLVAHLAAFGSWANVVDCFKGCKTFRPVFKTYLSVCVTSFVNYYPIRPGWSLNVMKFLFAVLAWAAEPTSCRIYFLYSIAITQFILRGDVSSNWRVFTSLTKSFTTLISWPLLFMLQ